MRILVCPDSFTGTLSAAQATDAIVAGWLRTVPQDTLIRRPLSDGGPGFVDAIEAGLGGRRRTVRVSGPWRDLVDAQYLITEGGAQDLPARDAGRPGAGPPDVGRPDAGRAVARARAAGRSAAPGGGDAAPPDRPARTAWIECASAAGLHLVPAARRDPTSTTSLGVGQLVLDAIRAGATRVVLGVGGTGTSDGGAGLLAGLGARCARGDLTAGGGSLGDVTGVDLTAALAATDGIALEVATDVDVPLLGPRGAARGFAPQKGANPEQVEVLEAALRHWAHQLGRTEEGLSPAVALGAGAGGGIGAALVRLGARRVAGIATVLAASGVGGLLRAEPRAVDLVVTGEGSFDWQSLHGKVIAGVAAEALVHAIPVIVLAGRVDVTRREWITAGVAAAFPAAPAPGQEPADGLAHAARRAAGTWSRTT